PFPGTVPYPTIDSIPHWFLGVAAYQPSYQRLRDLGVPGVTPMVSYQAYPDNVKKLFETGLVLDNSVTLSTPLGKSGAFITTISRTDHEGIVPNSSFTRTNFSVGGNNQFDNGLRIGANLAYTSSLQEGVPGGAIGSAQTSSYMARSLYLGRNWDLHGQPFEDPVTHESLFMLARGQADNP